MSDPTPIPVMPKIFVDGDGVRWAARPILYDGDRGVPMGFAFTSQDGRRRRLDGVLADCVLWQDFDDHEWRELLMATYPVQPRNKPKRRRLR